MFRTLWCSFLIGAVISSSALAQNATSSGPSVEQSVEELLTRQEEFDSFGWPAEGRFNPFPATLEKYISLNQRLWNDFGFSYFYKPTLMTQASGRPNNNLTTNFQHNILAYWRMAENDEIGTMALVGSVLQVRQISSTNGIQFMNALGMKSVPSQQ